MTDKIKESDLYPPIKTYFTENGYQVQGEVNGVDMVISKDDQHVGIELKTSFNLKLLLQAVDRQKYFDSVYVAIEKPRLKNRRYQEIIHVLKRLEIGLITVTFLKKGPQVYIEHHPLTYHPRPNKRKKDNILKEVKGRTGIVDNVGGSHKTKRVTVYREASLFIALVLSKEHESSPKLIKEYTNNPKTGQILYQNHYGWFQRIGQGLYSLSDKGYEALSEYREIVDYFKILIERDSHETD